MTLAHRMRLALRKAGVDVARWPQSDSRHRLHRALFSVGPDVLLDVGANDGGFVQSVRAFGYQGPAVSFEPSTLAFAKLQRAAESDPDWQAERIGLGDQDTAAVLNVAGNQQASSSLLPMLELHRQAAPDASYVAEEKIEVVRLDTWMQRSRRDWQRMALKLDVQGFDKQVLAGAEATLPRIASVQIELSARHLYEGDWLWDEAAQWLAGKGFSLAGLAPGFTDERTGQMLQFDAVFVR